MPQEKKKTNSRQATDEPTQLMTIRIPVRWHEVLRKQSFDSRQPINRLVQEALKEKFGLECGAAGG